MASLTPVDNDPFAAQPSSQDSLPVITDDGSNWATQANRPTLTPVDQNPFGASDRGPPVWSSSPLSLLPVSQYANGSYGFDGNAGMLGAGKRFIGHTVQAIEGLPNLARQVGSETWNNVATPGAAGQVANLAALATPGDVLAPGLAGKTVRAEAPTPSELELLKTGGKDLNAAGELGVDYSLPHAVDLSNNVEQSLYNQGIGPADAPRTFAKLAEARDLPAGAVSMPVSGLMGIRRGFSRLTADKSASDMDRAAAATALGHYQSFLENPPPEAVLAGPATAASDLVARGNANYGAGKNSQLVTNRGESADLHAGSANSGRNYDNVIRQKLRPLVDPSSPQRFLLKNFTPEEVGSVKDVVRGAETPLQNRIRTIGNLGGGGHGVAATALGLGAGMLGEHLMGPAGTAAGFAVPLAGSIARTIQNNNARAAVEGLAERLRQRSPLYQERVANAGYTANPIPWQVAATRGIIADQTSPNSYPDMPFAKGGSVKKPTHEFLVNRLMGLAEKAQRAEKKRTAPILDMPDRAVTAALAKAQEAI